MSDPKERTGYLRRRDDSLILTARYGLLPKKRGDDGRPVRRASVSGEDSLRRRCITVAEMRDLGKGAVG